MKKIAIIGAGNIGTAIASGLLQEKFVGASDLTISRRNIERLNDFKELGVNICSDNVKAIQSAECIVLAVKPFQIQDVAREIAPHVDLKRQLLISVITGVGISDLKALFGEHAIVFRAMPNTAAAIGQSMTEIAHENATLEQTDFVVHLFNTIGKSVLIDEKLMDAATVLGACGTAFALRYIRASIQAGVEIGFDVKTATTIVAQTVKGAAELLLINGSHPEEEIDKVTTPKGCTIAGLNEMEHQGFSSSIIRGLKASHDRIVKEM